MISKAELDAAFAAFVEARETGADVRESLRYAIDAAHRALGHRASLGRRDRALLADAIVDAACVVLETTRRDLTAPNRATAAAVQRRSVVVAMRRFGLSYPEIGRALGGRDHATMIWAYRTAKESDHALADRIREQMASAASAEGEVLHAVG